MPTPHPLDWNAKLVRFFLYNPRLAWLLIIFFLVGGLASLTGLRREGFPAVSGNIVLIQTLYPGASSTEVEQQITNELESALKDSKGLNSLSSVSRNSVSVVTASYEESLELDQVLQDVQTRVQSSRSRLPADSEVPQVNTIQTSGPSFTFGITQSGTELAAIRTEAEKLASYLASVSGVKSAKLAIEKPTRIAVLYRPADLRAQGVSLTTLNQVIQGSNVNYPVGTLDIEGKQQALVSQGEFKSVSDLENTIVGLNPQTQTPVLLKDIATVSSELTPDTTIERFGHRQDNTLVNGAGTLINVEVASDADVIRTKEAIDQEIDRRKDAGEINKDLTIVPLIDQAKSTHEQIQEIIDAAIGSEANWYLLGGLQLLFLAMLLFVNWRAALIATLAVPLSLGFTLITLNLLDVQLNTIVLFSMILVLGLIVDPAIVMIEAIQRYRDLKYKPEEAIIEAGRRYGASLFIAVATSLIVFVPFGVVSGIFGQIIKYIPLTVIPALLASYFVPMALLPQLMLRLPHRQQKGDTTPILEHEGLSRAARFVMSVNAWILQKTWRELLLLVVSVFLVFASLSVVGLGGVNIVQFSTPKDNPQLGVSTTFNKGLTNEARELTAQQVEEVLVKEATIKQFFYYNQSRDSLSIFVELQDKAERETDEAKSKEVVKRLKDALAKVPNLAEFNVSEQAVGPPQSLYQIQTQIYANDAAKLERAAKDIGQFLSRQEGVTRVDDGFTNKSEPELRIVLDRTRVAAAGLSSFEIGQQLRSLIDETEVSRLREGNTTRDIYLINASKPTSVDEIGQLRLLSRTGTSVALSDIASIEQGSSIDQILHDDGLRYASIKARVEDPKQVAKVQEKLDSYLSPERLNVFGLQSQSNEGEFEDIAKSFRELGIALAIAVLLTYLALVLQFKSFSQPLIMLFTVPLSLIGVFPALWLTGSDLGFLELLGVTILVGIVENVAIFLIDYANQLIREQGVTARVAIIQASGVRFRPIILTKLVCLASMLPLAIASDFWRGLAVVIIAGIGLSGFFSLMVIPILYVWLDSLRRRLHRSEVI